MSRLGKTPIKLPKGVEVKVLDGEVQIKGPKGSLVNKIPAGVSIEQKDGHVQVNVSKEMDDAKHGLYRNLLKNSILGVSGGFEKKLTLVGIGFRAAIRGNILDLQLGYSHTSHVKIPKEIKVEIDKGTSILITGIDKQLVGQFAANVRSLRPPEPYKGKGVRYEDEYVRKKEGKAAKGK